MPEMKAVIAKKAGSPFEVVTVPIPEPKSHEVLIKVQACGICHSDMFVREGQFPGIEYPRIPGHEVVGEIVKLGDSVKAWEKNQRVGVGWHGGYCGHCEPCRAGDFTNCENSLITGISFNGGYAEYMTAPATSLAKIPASLESQSAAPLLCAGITTYNALRNSGARPGDLVAVQGIGGLGHLGVQYARHMGFETVAISGSDAKRELAKELGAEHFIDGSQTDPADALQKLGGAQVILATAPSSKAITQVIGGLGRNGRIVLVGVDAEPIQVSPLQLIGGRHSILGWACGHAKDSEDTLSFSALSGIAPMIETFPLEQANEAYDRMLANDTRFRAVLTP